MAHTHRMGNYNSNYQTKIDMNCCDHYAHKINGRWVCGIEPGVCEDEYNPGGYLKGPKHERGGISAIVGGNQPIELEGGEYIVNAQTTKALGINFLDELNSTATTYHQGGFKQGQLPSPSNYAGGGKVPNRRNKMARGRRASTKRRGGTIDRAPARRMARGGTPPRGGRTALRLTRKMAAGGSPRGGMTGNRLNSNKRQYLHGGGIHSDNPCPNNTYHPTYTNFIQQPVTPGGTVEYFCCQTSWRTPQCNLFDDMDFLSGLIFAQTTNMAI